MRVGERLARHPIFGERAAPRMAEPAGFDLLAYRLWRRASQRRAGLGIVTPAHAGALVETHQQTLRRVVVVIRPPAVLVLGPGDMRRALPVTGFATDADLGETRVKAILRRVVVLLDAGRVALRAHEIPILIELGPMQHVVVPDLLVRIEVEPVLASLLLGACVPGKRQRLDAAVRKLDEILLQGIDAKSVFHLERRKLAVGTVRFHEELAVLAKEARVDVIIVEA